jgi:hypothetical protein
MSFKSWYHKSRLNEDEFTGQPLDDEAPIPQQEMPADKATVAAPKSSNTGAFRNFFGDDMKASLQNLGKALGDSIYEFAMKEFVTPDDFVSEDAKEKYEVEVRDKIAEDTNLKLTEILRQVGIFLNNAKGKYTK